MHLSLKLVAIAAGVAFVLGGCVELEVHKQVPGVITGIPYTLPEKTFLIAVQYQVTKCDVSGDGDLLFEVQKTVTTTPSVRAGERFYIPASSLKSSFKEIDITIESFENSTLKSVSATIEDKSGPAITAAVGTAIKVAALAVPISPVLAAAPSDREKYCKSKIIKALDVLASSKAPEPKEPPQADVPLKGKAKPQKGTAVMVPVAEKKTVITPEQVTKANSDLQSKLVEQWAPSKADMQLDPKRGHKQVYPTVFVSDWLTPAGIAKLLGNEKQAAILITEAVLEFDTPVHPDSDLGEKTAGFVLRQPVSGLLRICDGLCSTDPTSASGVILATEHVVPQLGDYVIVPLKNRMFEKQTLTVTMTQDGALEKLGLHTFASAGAAIENLNTNLDAIKADRDARKKAKEAALEEAKNSAGVALTKMTEDNGAITKCLVAQKDLKDAGGTPIGVCQ